MSGAGLAQGHATLAGLKALVTRMCTDGMEEARKCCGGHGYLLSSGIPELLGFALQVPPHALRRPLAPAACRGGDSPGRGARGVSD